METKTLPNENADDQRQHSSLVEPQMSQNRWKPACAERKNKNNVDVFIGWLINWSATAARQHGEIILQFRLTSKQWLIIIISANKPSQSNEYALISRDVTRLHRFFLTRYVSPFEKIIQSIEILKQSQNDKK